MSKAQQFKQVKQDIQAIRAKFALLKAEEDILNEQIVQDSFRLVEVQKRRRELEAKILELLAE